MNVYFIFNKYIVQFQTSMEMSSSISYQNVYLFKLVLVFGTFTTHFWKLAKRQIDQYCFSIVTSYTMQICDPQISLCNK